MVRVGLAIAIGVLALAVYFAPPRWSRPESSRADDRIETLEREVEAIREKLAASEGERARLEAEVAALRDAAVAPVEPPSGTNVEPEPTPVATEEATPPDPAAAPEVPAGLPAFDADRLVEAGFRRDDVERFRARVDEIQLAQLGLRDRATREGWVGTPRFREESQALQQSIGALRGEFGDALYDWMLFSSGQPNRVAIAEVMTGGAGESAGLARGDVILRYDDGPMFDALQLRDATTGGRAGELVAVEVYRQSENGTVRVFVPRGPIGVRLTTALMEPPPPG